MEATYQRLRLDVAPRSTWEGDWVVLPVFADKNKVLGHPGQRAGEVLSVQEEDGVQKLLVSLGSEAKLSAENIRRAGKAAAKWLIKRDFSKVAAVATDLGNLGIEDGLSAFCEGLLLGSFSFDLHKSQIEPRRSINFYILAEQDIDEIQRVVSRCVTIVESVNLARALSHEPPNMINPHTLAERAIALAEGENLHCTVLDERALSEMGAGAILSVGSGSKTSSRLIVLEYPGAGSGLNTRPVVVIGKAITFDTGGYSLKDKKAIVEMKFDKCGGADILGIMRAVARLGLSTPVVGIVATAENMISEKAYRPNDIIKTLSGKTVEIISTDAEGRMVLSDALTYAHTHYQPRAMVDIATLTGGIVTALGNVRAGLFSNDDELAGRLLSFGERTHERLWRMPLDEDYFELIKGEDSDLRNSTGLTKASPIVGGIFLKQFVPDGIPWAHVDIAGMDFIERAYLPPYATRGATGFGVRLLIEFLASLD